MKVAEKKIGVVKKKTDHSESLYIALKMLLAADDNRSALTAVEVAKRAILAYEGKPID